MALTRKLGLSAILAIVVGDMIGSGIFFTPGELAAVATAEWQVYFFWSLCGLITLCGAMTLAELATLIPRAGVSYHALTEAYGPFAGFMQAWMMVLVSGPGAIAGVAILFGELANRVFGDGAMSLQRLWAVGAIGFFTVINLRGVEWGGRTQEFLTSVKVIGLILLVAGGVFLADAAPRGELTERALADGGLIDLLRFVGLGVAVVLFTYDGWIDASNIAGEVRDPGRTFPRAMAIGVMLITGIYLLVNFAFLRVVPLEAMRVEPTLVATRVAEAAFGGTGGEALSILIWVSIFGALGGLIMTLPRLFYAAAVEYVDRSEGTFLSPLFRGIAAFSERRSVPSGAVLFAAATSVAALLFFGSFSRIVTFFVVPFQLMNILMVSSIFVLRPKLSTPASYRLPGYPFVPAFFIFVMLLFVLAALYYNPVDSLIGIALTLAGAPVFWWLTRKKPDESI